MWQKFWQMNRIMIQEIGQWGRCTVHDCIIKIKPLLMVPAVFNSKKNISEPTHLKETFLEINFVKDLGNVPIMCT